MKNFKEFKARMESDVAFREKFRNVKDEAQLLKLASAEGYNVEILDEEDLDLIAGGVNAADVNNIIKRGVDRIGNAVDNAKKNVVIGASVAKVGIETTAAAAFAYVRSLFS